MKTLFKVLETISVICMLNMIIFFVVFLICIVWEIENAEIWMKLCATFGILGLIPIALTKDKLIKKSIDNNDKKNHQH